MVAGRVLGGRYELIEQLGQGGMGSVWRAQRLTNQAEVAIKLIDPDLVYSREAIGRFRREAQAAEAIRSTHVVQILDYDVDDGTPFIVMELLKGEDLSTRLRREHTLTPQQTTSILGQVAKAIALAHDRGIVHRDLKPANVFIVREYDEEVVKVLDFGIAKHESGLDESSGLHTRTGMLLGTPFYMSPEQALGQEVTPLADIWSFSVIAFECLTGKRAFVGKSFLALGNAICKDPMPVPSAYARVPTGFDEWFAQAAARKLSDRFQSIRVAADALRVVCGVGSVRSSVAGVPIDNSPTVVSPNFAEKATEVPDGTTVVAPLQITGAPASRSLPAPADTRTRSVWVMSASAAATLIVGAAIGLRALGSGNDSTSSSSAAVLPPRGSGTLTGVEPPKTTKPPSDAVAVEALPKVIETTSIGKQGQSSITTSSDAGVVETSPAKSLRASTVDSRRTKPVASVEVGGSTRTKQEWTPVSIAPTPAPLAAPTASKKQYQPEF